MKRLFLICVLTITTTIIYGQKSIDALFEKYAGRDGFVTVTLNGNLLKFASCLDNESDNEDSLPANISEIRILVQEDDELKVENFYDKIIRDIDLDSYEEFLRVKETDQDLRILVRSDGKKFKELLLIAGGEDNALIQIKGNMTYEEAKKLSRNAKKNNGLNMLADHK